MREAWRCSRRSVSGGTRRRRFSRYPPARRAKGWATPTDDRSNRERTPEENGRQHLSQLFPSSASRAISRCQKLAKVLHGQFEAALSALISPRRPASVECPGGKGVPGCWMTRFKRSRSATKLFAVRTMRARTTDLRSIVPSLSKAVASGRTWVNVSVAKGPSAKMLNWPSQSTSNPEVQVLVSCRRCVSSWRAYEDHFSSGAIQVGARKHRLWGAARTIETPG